MGLKLKLLKYSDILVVYDRNVADFAIKIAGSKPSLAIEATEQTKTMDTVMAIDRWFLQQGADRKTLVLAVGGGITTDIVGFAAAIYKRGIRYANVPTSLLGMVDAATGGKTGVNLDSFKNMLGAFQQPEFVHIDTDYLRTLPKRELLSGAAELLKTFIIADRENYDKALKVISEGADPKALEPLVKDAAKIKARIVKKDPRDEGRRMVLNLGHTYGHAIEWWQHSKGVANPYTHGEAVSIGMAIAARKSEEAGIAKPGLAAKIKADLNYCGLPTELPCLEEDLGEALEADKKTEGGQLNFVYIKEIGSVTVKKI